MKNRITRKTLAIEIKQDCPYLKMSLIDNILKSFFDKVYEHLQMKDTIELRGFGTLSVQKRKPMINRTLKNEYATVKFDAPERYRPHIKFSKLYHYSRFIKE